MRFYLLCDLFPLVLGQKNQGFNSGHEKFLDSYQTFKPRYQIYKKRLKSGWSQGIGIHFGIRIYGQYLNHDTG